MVPLRIVAGLLPFAACTAPEPGRDVTLLLNVVDHDFQYLPVRMKHLMAHVAYTPMVRELVLDTRGGDGVPISFLELFRRLQSDDLVDSWSVVDYSARYVDSVKQRAGWRTRHVKHKFAGKPSHAGNLVYFFMADRCNTTYCAHFDTDIVFWSSPGSSWISDGIRLLETSSDVLTVMPPSPLVTPEQEQWRKSGRLQVRLEAGLRIEKGTCLFQTFVTARVYLMHVGRYRRILSSAQHKSGCGGDRHWEELVSCLACRWNLSRITLADRASYRAIHLPFHSGPDELESVLDRCWERGVFEIGYLHKDGYNAAPEHKWLQYPCAKAEQQSNSSSRTAAVDNVTITPQQSNRTPEAELDSGSPHSVQNTSESSPRSATGRLQRALFVQQGGYLQCARILERALAGLLVLATLARCCPPLGRDMREQLRGGVL